MWFNKNKIPFYCRYILLCSLSRIVSLLLLSPLPRLKSALPWWWWWRKSAIMILDYSAKWDLRISPLPFHSKERKRRRNSGNRKFGLMTPNPDFIPRKIIPLLCRLRFHFPLFGVSIVSADCCRNCFNLFEEGDSWSWELWNYFEILNRIPGLLLQSTTPIKSRFSVPLGPTNQPTGQRGGPFPFHNGLLRFFRPQLLSEAQWASVGLNDSV